MSTKNFKRGFTIVELLIVVVVIGILAAITIVAYNGIQTRAENTKTLSGVNQYAKAISIIQTTATNGQYPIASACFGGMATCSQVTDGAATCFATGGASQSVAFDNTIKAVTNSLPVISTQVMNCAGKNYAGGLYFSSDGKNAYIYYYLRGNQQCPNMGVFALSSRGQQDDTTLCFMMAPVLP